MALARVVMTMPVSVGPTAAGCYVIYEGTAQHPVQPGIWKPPYVSNTASCPPEHMAVYCQACDKYVGTVQQLYDYPKAVCPDCGAFA